MFSRPSCTVGAAGLVRIAAFSSFAALLPPGFLGDRQHAPASGNSAPGNSRPAEANVPAATNRDGDRLTLSFQATGTLGEELTPEQQQQVEKLKQRDREVRAHEQAHVAAGGQYVVSGPTYEYQRGPDGRRYAVGGEVQLDTSPESDPEQAIRKAQVIRAAALAPAEPSSQDRAVAAAATKMEADARIRLRKQQVAERSQTATGPAAAVSSRTAASSQRQEAFRVGQFLNLVA